MTQRRTSVYTYGRGPSEGKARFHDARLFTGFGTHKRSVPIV